MNATARQLDESQDGTETTEVAEAGATGNENGVHTPTAPMARRAELKKVLDGLAADSEALRRLPELEGL